MSKIIRAFLLAAAFIAVLTGGASAALISLVKMQYSAAHPVPHLHYEGDTTSGDLVALQKIYDTFVKCRLECLEGDGGATAVLTMNGPGGDYRAGLDIADFLRTNHIATVVERGMKCYSACAFAFLGGSGYSPMEGYGSYIDRMVEPGSIVGFHAPYRNAASFMEAVEERGAMGAQGVTRDNLALMVKELVRWNVDPEVLFYMVGMGPDESYDLVTPRDLYFARVALPPTPTLSWIEDTTEAIRNVCTRLLAIHERTDPDELVGRVAGEILPNIATAEPKNQLDGFRLTDRLLSIGHCSVDHESLATDGDYEVGLYFNTMLTYEQAVAMGYPDLGLAGSAITFFNRQKGWSSAGAGGSMSRRILQWGPMNHYFLPLDTPLDQLKLPGVAEIEKNRFAMRLYPLMARMDEELGVDDRSEGRRISHAGDVWMFEQVGPPSLVESARAMGVAGRIMARDDTTANGFLRQGIYEHDATPFFTVGLINPEGNAATVVHAMILKGDDTAAGLLDYAQMRRIVCNTEFYGVKPAC